MANLHDKTLVMIIGPAAIGKSTIMHAACELDTRFGYVTSFTTRPDRGDGKSTYRHLTEQAVHELEVTGRITTSLRHPTTGFMYGTTTDSYNAQNNLLDTLSASVDMYRELTFKRTLTVSLTVTPDTWESWILNRYPTASDERTNRLTEAIQSIEWSLSQTNNHFWLINQPDNLQATAQQLISIVDDAPEPSEVPPVAYDLLRRAKHLLSYD